MKVRIDKDYHKKTEDGLVAYMHVFIECDSAKEATDALEAVDQNLKSLEK